MESGLGVWLRCDVSEQPKSHSGNPTVCTCRVSELLARVAEPIRIDDSRCPEKLCLGHSCAAYTNSWASGYTSEFPPVFTQLLAPPAVDQFLVKAAILVKASLKLIELVAPPAIDGKTAAQRACDRCEPALSTPP